MPRKLKSTDSVPLRDGADASAHGCLLLVEDNDELRGSTAQLFRLLGWDVFTASSMRAAVELAMEHRPTVIVTEAILPDVRGYNFARTLRGAVEHDITLVALTQLSEQSFDELRAAGFDLVFSKPIDAELVHAQLVRT